MIIDFHSHFFPVDAVQRLPDAPVQIENTANGACRLTVGQQAFTLDRRLIDLERQQADMRQQSLAARTLMPPPFTLLYELPPEEGRRWSRAINDGIAEAARASPHELIGFATVPLQDVAGAVDETKRAVRELGLRGLEIATSVNGVGLDDPGLDPFWSVAESLRVPILIHPHYVSGAARMGDYHLRNLVGNPAETALAGARLLFGGVLERFPDLRIILSHGGGALPHLIGRLGHGFSVRPECRTRATAPLDHLRKLYYDTIVFDPTTLRHVEEVVGFSQLVLGTDYPFDMSEEQPVAFIQEAGFSDEQTAAILNAGERLLAAVTSEQA